jgi:hypothetical protein
MKPSVLCISGVICLGVALSGKNLWEWAPTLGWFFAVFSSLFWCKKKSELIALNTQKNLGGSSLFLSRAAMILCFAVVKDMPSFNFVR